MPDPRDNTNPLTPEDIAKLRRARQLCNTANSQIQRMKDCGIDCRAEQSLSEALCQRIDKMLQHFGGSEPSR